MTVTNEQKVLLTIVNQAISMENQEIYEFYFSKLRKLGFEGEIPEFRSENEYQVVKRKNDEETDREKLYKMLAEMMKYTKFYLSDDELSLFQSSGSDEKAMLKILYNRFLEYDNFMMYVVRELDGIEILGKLYMEKLKKNAKTVSNRPS